MTDAGVSGDRRFDLADSLELIEERESLPVEIDDRFDRIDIGQLVLNTMQIGQNLAIARQELGRIDVGFQTHQSEAGHEQQQRGSGQNLVSVSCDPFAPSAKVELQVAATSRSARDHCEQCGGHAQTNNQRDHRTGSSGPAELAHRANAADIE